MAFGAVIRDENSKSLFIPSAQCFVFHSKYNISKTTNGDINTGIPASINCVFFTREISLNQDSGWGNLNIGWNVVLRKNGFWVIETSLFEGTLYCFMPGYDANRLQNNKPTWGARFYDEEGRASFVGWQRPMVMSSSIKSVTGEAFNGKDSGNIYHAIATGAVGQARIYMGSGTTAMTIFKCSVSMYLGRVSYKFVKIGEAPGGGGSPVNTGNVPLIDVRNYD